MTFSYAMPKNRRERERYEGAAAAAAAWNAAHPIGTAVIVTMDSGEERITTTRSLAWALGDQTAVVQLAGIPASHDLIRVRPA